MNTRILLDDKPTVCSPYGANGHNNWDMYNPADEVNHGFPPNDPRLVQAYVTAYGAFSNTSGTTGTSQTVPITDFASFYVTGWTAGNGAGFTNPCQSTVGQLHGDDPVPGNNAGLIVGHFVRYIDKINTGGGTEVCDMSSNAFGNCVPVLTQ